MNKTLGRKAYQVCFKHAEEPEYICFDKGDLPGDYENRATVLVLEGRFFTTADLEQFARRVIDATEVEMNRYMVDWRHDKVIAELKKEGLL